MSLKFCFLFYLYYCDEEIIVVNLLELIKRFTIVATAFWPHREGSFIWNNTKRPSSHLFYHCLYVVWMGFECIYQYGLMSIPVLNIHEFGEL